jgi:hypothetical protein
MLTEADMIRIMAAKYNLAESVAKENFENKSHDVLSDDDLSEKLFYEMPNISDCTADS